MEIEETPIACSTASSASPPRSPVRDRSPVHSGLQVDLSADEDVGDDNEFDPSLVSYQGSSGEHQRYRPRGCTNITAIQSRGRGRGRVMRGNGRGRGRGRVTRGNGRGEKRGRGRGMALPSSSNQFSTGASATRGTSKQRSSFVGPLSQHLSSWKRDEGSKGAYTFSGPQPGPVKSVNVDTKAVDLFLCFFTPEALDLVVDETNRFASQCRSVNLSAHSRPWRDVTREELMAFFGMLFQLKLYWSTKHELIRQHIADVMPLVRFQQIMRFLHLNDTEHQIGAKQPGYDPLYKVRKLLDIVTNKFEIEYNLNESVSVDEAMIPFKGRLSNNTWRTSRSSMASRFLYWLMGSMAT